MPYATQAEIQLAAGGADQLRQLSDFAGNGTINADVIARAQAAADGVIDSYLRLRVGVEDLEELRANPTTTISELAAAEAVYWMKKSRGMVSELDLNLRKEREVRLKGLKAGELRQSDTPKAQRATFVENHGDVTRKGTKGMW
ncbi:MAG: phage protein Gp36 family protein [Kofleriaceae bacterium]